MAKIVRANVTNKKGKTTEKILAYWDNSNYTIPENSQEVESYSLPLKGYLLYPKAENPCESEVQKAIYRLLGLPLTKELVYYSNGYDAKIAKRLEIAKITVEEEYNTFCWLNVVVKQESNNNVYSHSINIHSDFLAEMQLDTGRQE